MKGFMLSLLFLACLFLAADATRPLLGVSRELLGQDSWIKPGACPNGIGFGAYKAVVLPQHRLIAGNIQFYNHGPKPFSIHSAGFGIRPKNAFRNLGMGPLTGGLRCPNTLIPAGGSLTCGFVTPADRPNAYEAFQPYFLPANAQAPCLCQQQLPLVPVAAGSSASAAASAGSQSAGRGFGVAKANAVASSLAQAWGAAPGFSFPNPSRPPMPTWNGDINAFANGLCNAYFGGLGVSTSQATSNAKTLNGNAAADANAAAQGSLADATGEANSVALNGAAASNANTDAQSFGGPAMANNKATATGTSGAKATGSGQAVALGGPAFANSGSKAQTNCGPAFAGNKAGALSNQAALATGSAQALTGCGPASAISGTSAVVVPTGPNVGAALASDKAHAAGSTANAQSSANAVNGGLGPAVADSAAVAQGQWESSASSNSKALAANGPAVARSSAMSG